MKVIVVGSSAGGQFAALLLARAGHRVVLLDRDDVRPTPSVDDAAAVAFRAMAPQLVQPHALLPRCRLLLREHLPDIYDALLAAGALESPLAVAAPTGVQIGEQPGDDRFTSMATRRSTLDLILRRAVVDEERVECRFGLHADAFVAGAGSPPRIRGVRTGAGEILADLVVDATGRRTHVDSWLRAVGAEETVQESAECGLAYYSRHYRLRPGATSPGHPATRLLLALDEFTTGLWNGDNGTAMLAIAPLAADRRFRAVREPTEFDRVVAEVPPFKPWLDVLKPVSDVFVMGGLHNTWRRLVSSGAPVATGLALVGDSRCTTNPTFGRGLPLALIEASDLAAALNGCDDVLSLTCALEALADDHVYPFFLDQAHNDLARLAMLRHAVLGAPAPAVGTRADAVSFGELRTAMLLHEDGVRAFWRVMGMLDRPDNVYSDPQVVRRTRSLLASVA